jgi:hypothetical protein
MFTDVGEQGEAVRRDPAEQLDGEDRDGETEDREQPAPSGGRGAVDVGHSAGFLLRERTTSRADRRAAGGSRAGAATIDAGPPHWDRAPFGVFATPIRAGEA